eukprot:s3_g37.t3
MLEPAQIKEECRSLDASSATTVTSNRCNRGSRSAWLDLEGLEELQQKLPALAKLSTMLAGLPLELQNTNVLSGVHLQDWRPGHGGELRIHESAGQRPDPRHFQALEPKARLRGEDPSDAWSWSVTRSYGSPTSSLPRSVVSTNSVGALLRDLPSSMAEDFRSEMGSSLGGSTDPRPISKNSLAIGDQACCSVGKSSTFREALHLHLGELQSKLVAEHECRLSPEHRSLEQLVESLKAENERLRKLLPHEAESLKLEKRDKTQVLRDACQMMREHSHLSDPFRKQSPSPRDRDVAAQRSRKASEVSKRQASVRKTVSAAKQPRPARRSSVRGTTVLDLRPFRQDSQELGSISSMDRQVESLLRTALAAWKEFTFQYIRDEDEDESEQEVEALRQAAYKEWPEDPNSNEWQAQLFRTDLARTMSGDLNASKSDRLNAGPNFWRKHLVTYPSSRRRMLWDLLGLMLVIWDIFAIPMNAFELTDIVSLYIMSWVSTLFWTIDFPTNFFLGPELSLRNFQVQAEQVNSRSCVYNLANTLTDEMKKHPKVHLEACGKTVAESLD